MDAAATLENMLMSLETLIENLIDALKENTAAHKGGKAEPAERATSRRGSARDDDKREPAAERSSRRGAAREETKKGPSEADLKKAVADFLDLPEDAKGEEEYTRRLEKVVDPIFDKAEVKELQDLPEKYWADLLDTIEDYLKEEKAGADRGARRSRR
jgi:hypothetical protein